MEQKHRIFIAITLPENLRKKLWGYKERWPELPVRWSKPNNLHITLAFLGYLDNEELLKVIEAVKKTGDDCAPFVITLNKVSYGPFDSAQGRPFKDKSPKMIWATGVASEELNSLYNKLNESLSELYAPERREFTPHITLGRIRQWEFRKIEKEVIPEVDEDINIKFTAESIEVMESVLKRGGPEYVVLESSSFSQ